MADIKEQRNPNMAEGEQDFSSERAGFNPVESEKIEGVFPQGGHVEEKAKAEELNQSLEAPKPSNVIETPKASIRKPVDPHQARENLNTFLGQFMNDADAATPDKAMDMLIQQGGDEENRETS